MTHKGLHRAERARRFCEMQLHALRQHKAERADLRSSVTPVKFLLWQETSVRGQHRIYTEDRSRMTFRGPLMSKASKRTLGDLPWRRDRNSWGRIPKARKRRANG